MSKKSVYEMVTDRIVEQLDKGVIPWRKPWLEVRGAAAYSRATGKPYSLINQMMLKPGEYLTYKQAKAAGGNVKKGEKSSIVVFWKMLEIEEEGKKKTIPFLRYYNVFNLDQCENIEQKYDQEIEAIPALAGIDEAEALLSEYVNREGIKLQADLSNQAFYSPDSDEIVLPNRGQFGSIVDFYGAAYHEMVHSTGHKERLNRLTQNARFGSQVYSKEELVIASWRKKLSEDSRLIVSAAGKAQKAVEYILGEEG